MQKNLTAAAFIQSLDYRKMTLIEVTEIVNAKGHQLFISQVADILKKIRIENNEVITDPTKDCGINREANPCGDASDY